jgi:hypothetical protein
MGNPKPQASPSFQDFTNTSTGLGDGLTLGLTRPLRDGLGLGDQVDECDLNYQLGSGASFVFGTGRLAYAGLAKAGSFLAKTGAQASKFRSQLKTVFSGGLTKNVRPPNLSKYPTDEALKAAAGRTNPLANAYGAGTAASGAVGASGGSGSGCDDGCD